MFPLNHSLPSFLVDKADAVLRPYAFEAAAVICHLLHGITIIVGNYQQRYP